MHYLSNCDDIHHTKCGGPNSLTMTNIRDNARILVQSSTYLNLYLMEQEAKTE